MGGRFIVFAVGAVVGALFVIVVGCFQLKGPQVVVREPEVPGEATIEYSPPPLRSIPTGIISEAGPMLLDMLRPKMVKVTGDIYAAIGYGFGTVVMVITDDGLVIVDASVALDSAEEILADFRKITDKPIKYMVYTHSHQDHTNGSRVFYSEGVEVVAPVEFIEFERYQDVMLGAHHRRARAIQFGFIEPDYAFPLPISGGPTTFMRKDWAEVIKPTVTFEKEYSFTLGKKRFELFLTPGETPDTISIWMPEDRALIVGDNHYHSFPNLSTPLLEPRPVRDWIKSLERYLEMEPEILIPMHTEVVKGRDAIRERLTNYRDAVKHVHDETVRCINEGKSVEEAVAEVRLPERLARLPYLQEYYGRVDWSVRGIYRGYTGWYKGDGIGLFPLPKKYRARELVELSGGANNILARAIELQKAGEHQLCAELCDVVLAANPEDKAANVIKAASMAELAFAVDNLNSFLCYRSAYSIHMKAAGVKPQAGARTAVKGIGD
jgi:alkyl sulfatase BDS1-like metallo-beta-lactamase superfamily hydrolase